jgi:hypothetical protein
MKIILYFLGSTSSPECREFKTLPFDFVDLNSALKFLGNPKEYQLIKNNIYIALKNKSKKNSRKLRCKSSLCESIIV